MRDLRFGRADPKKPAAQAPVPETPLKVYSAEFEGMWRTGAAVITARNSKEAREFLRAALKRAGITDAHAADDANVRLVGLTRARCVILTNGDI